MTLRYNKHGAYKPIIKLKTAASQILISKYNTKCSGIALIQFL